MFAGHAMTDAQLWWLTLQIAILAAIYCGGGYLYVHYLVRKFDREFGDHRTPGEERIGPHTGGPAAA